MESALEATRKPTPKGGLIARLLAGETAALGRAISLLDGGPEIAGKIIRAATPNTGRAAVVGFTGPPGAGKSTLISAYISNLRQAGSCVAVLAVDPSSPYSGGALLGDRTRMGVHYDDPGVFIRSIATRGHLGGLARNIHQIIALADAAGWDTIILETVGAGQSETEVADLADVKIVVNAPGLGDDVQAIKAGILEIADILVVNKADLAGADRAVTQLHDMLRLRADSGRGIQVLRTVATEAEGIEDLAAAVAGHLKTADGNDPRRRALARARTLVANAAGQQAREALLSSRDTKLQALLAQVADGALDVENAARRALSGC